MNYALIFDNNQYTFVEMIRNDTKYAVVRPLEHKNEKKIKQENLVLLFQGNIEDLRPNIIQLKEEIDLNLLWELSEEQEVWLWEELTELYFNSQNVVQKLALFLSIVEPEILFSYQKEHKFKRCNYNEVLARKLQLAKQQEYQAKFEAIYLRLLQLLKPDWQIDALTLLCKPDKNSLEYKAANKAAKDLNLTLVELFFKLGYISSIEDMLHTSFYKQYFPSGTQLPEAKINDQAVGLPLNSQLQVFSIDDSNTTEIDDAFSIQKIADQYIIGIHIAAPALNSELLQIASERYSTVYYPGAKITMLPENIIAHYSLDQGKQLPVVSIYFTLNADLEIISSESKVEQVIISNNLRIEDLEQVFNNDNLQGNHGYSYETELKLLYQFALKLEEKRGKSSANQLMVDYNFSFDENKRVSIKPRMRGNPIDKLVSELMILANCSWGRMLTNAFVPAIYRVKQPMQPVSMTLTPNSHSGLNVDYYTWASSPLRRSVDLVNQSQIISLLQKNKPLTATDYTVANVALNFDEVYGSYLKFQDKMERYWSLRFLEQEKITKIKATFTYRNNVQLEGVPITLDVSSITKAQPAGSVITLEVSNLNFINQTFEFKLATS